jgi:RHS repeat-associated protein
MPVNIATGAASLEFDDIEVAGRVPLLWNTRYSTGIVDQVHSPIGRGWFGLAFCSLRLIEGGFVHTTARGAQERFEDPSNVVANGGVVRNLGAYLEVFRDSKRYVIRSWNVETDDIRHLCFDISANSDQNLRLTAIEDVSGDGIDLIWQSVASGSRLVALRQRVERRELRIGYDRAGWIDRLDLRTPEGTEHRLVTYEHDAAGQLARIADAAGFVDRFEYDAKGRVTREINKDGGVFHYRYDDLGRCVVHTGLNHYNERRLRYLQAVGITEMSDSYGNTTTYRYLPSGQIVLEIDPLGGQRRTEYDEHGRIVASTDAIGAVIRYGYDDCGNRALVTDALGNTTQLRYNARHQPVEMIDAAGRRWRREYDVVGRLTRVMDPLGGSWLYRYDAAGNVVELRNPLGAVRTMAYQNGAMQSITDWMGHATQFRFDSWGRVVERRDPQGELTQVRYDAVGNPIEVRLPDGTSILATYDHSSNLTRQIDTAGRMTLWCYGPCRRLLERTDAAGGTLRYTWGTEPGRLEQVINEKGEVHTFEHDQAGRVVAETSFDGARRQYRLDAEGRTSAFVNANGETVAIARDVLGRIVDQRLPDGENLHFVYNPLGELIEAVNDDIALAYERDALGRVVREMQGERWVRSEYDAAGGLLRVQTSEHHSVDYQVDANSRSVVCDVLGKTLRFERDANGREIGRTLPGGARLAQRYDAMGRLTAQQLTPSHGASYGPAPDTVRRLYTYDKSSGLVRSTDIEWGRADYAYDPVDRLLSALRSRGPSERFDYDRTGNITHIQAEGARLRDEVLLYGPGDRLVQHGRTRLEYDAEGRCTHRIEDADGPAPRVWRYEWNALDRLKSLTRPDGKVWRYRYDALARRIEKTCDGATACEYLWDRDVIAQELLPDAPSRCWLWEANSFAPVATVQHGRIYSVVNDQVGTPRELVDDRGSVAWAILLDSWGEVAESKWSAAAAPACDIRFQGQWADAESGLHYNFFRYYDPASGRYIGDDPLGLQGGTNAFRYAPNPLAWIDPLGLCNGNSKASQNEQHGYEIIDTHNGKVVVKVGVSGQPLNKNGSPRANSQVNRWNNEKPGNAGRYQVKKITKIEPAGPGARQNILTWEKNRASTLRASGQLNDPIRHKRP